MTTTNPRMVRVPGAELCVETFGDPGDPTVLLISGGGQSLDWWDVDLCRLLTDAGRHVVRYDHRDVGRSAGSPRGEPAYTATDLTTDPLRVLDALGVGRAHVVGLSMGGGIAQSLGIHHGDRLASLTLVATSRTGDDLPGPAAAILESFASPVPEPDWSDRAQLIDYRVDIERPYVGSLGLDETRVRRLATQEVDRSDGLGAGLSNHFIAPGDDDDLRSGIPGIGVPTLVLHGTDDPVFPLPHGEALAREIRGAVLVPVPGMGHEIPPPPTWGLVLPRLVAHTG